MLNLVGQRFGKLVVLDEIKRRRLKSGAIKTYRLCECDCGEQKFIPTANLRNGTTISCGCYNEEKKRLADGVAAKNAIFNQYIQNARRAGRSWTLTKDEFISLIMSNCHYCGKEPSSLKSVSETTGIVNYNGIDRIDNKFGYQFNNCVTCCYICNRAKHTMSVSEFDKWIIRIAINRKLL